MPELVALHALLRRPRRRAGRLRQLRRHLDVAASTGAAHDASTHVEVYIGIFIGAVTFTGSVVAFGKLSGTISCKPLMLPARHWLNLPACSW